MPSKSFGKFFDERGGETICPVNISSREAKKVNRIIFFGSLIIFYIWFCLCGICVEGGVIGIDLGDEFFKVALVSVGKPFEILLNSHSKRKTLSAVSFAEKARSIGDSATSNLIRFPEQTLIHTNGLLGYNTTKVDKEIEEGVKGANGYPIQFYPYKYIKDDERGVLKVKVRDDLVLYPEEITANLLGFIKDMAIQTEMGVKNIKHGTRVKIGGVATIPCSFNQRQRQAFVDAAELAGIEIMGLVHGPAAAAVHQSLDLTFENNSTSQTSLIYDFGSSSISAAIVKYSNISISGFGKQKEAVHVQMLGCSSVNNIGGHFIDLALAKKVTDEYKIKHKTDLTKFPKPMKIILAETTRMKHLLSANLKGLLSIESLHDDKDFKTEFHRQDIEDILTKLGVFDSMKIPVSSVLKQTNLTIADINSVELIGGGWRIPRIQEELAKMFHPHSLGQRLNGDEAMAMGASFIAANYSASFRVRKVFLTDSSVFSYIVHLMGVRESQDAKEKEELIDKYKELVAVGSRFYGTKTMLLKSPQDLDISLFENENVISKYKVRGIAEAFNKKFAHLESPKVALVFKISNAGIINLEKAHATFEETVVESIPINKTLINDKLLLNNTNSSNKTDSNDQLNSTTHIPMGSNSTETVESFPQNLTDMNVTNLSSLNNTEELVMETRTIKKKHVVHLNVTEFLTKPLPMSAEEKVEAKGKLARLDESDAEVAKLAKARNTFETYIYNLREGLYKNSSIIVSNYTELNAILKFLEEEEDWFYSNSSEADAELFTSKKKHLNKMTKSIFEKAFQYEVRNSTIKLMNATLRYSFELIEGFKNNRTWVPSNLTDLAYNTVNNIESWWNDVLQKQNALPLTAEPVFTKSDVNVRIKEIESTIQAIERIPKPAPPKASNNSTNTSPLDRNNTTTTTVPSTFPSKKDNGTVEGQGTSNIQENGENIAEKFSVENGTNTTSSTPHLNSNKKDSHDEL